MLAGEHGYLIGIYPEWNVKQYANYDSYVELNIGIYPEWNVKLYCHFD